MEIGRRANFGGGGGRLRQISAERPIQQSRRPMSKNRRLCLVAPDDVLIGGSSWGCRTGNFGAVLLPVRPGKYSHKNCARGQWKSSAAEFLGVGGTDSTNASSGHVPAAAAPSLRRSIDHPTEVSVASSLELRFAVRLQGNPQWHRLMVCPKPSKNSGLNPPRINPTKRASSNSLPNAPRGRTANQSKSRHSTCS